MKNFIIAAIVIFFLVICVSNCSKSSQPTSSKKETKTEQSASNSSKSDSDSKSGSSNNSSSNSSSNLFKNQTPSYADPRWPTFDSSLLAIPESSRWYTAASRVGTYGTIAGPVAGVYDAYNSNGHPIFIDIGVNYPSSQRARIVIWGEDMQECYSLVQDANKPDAWISVTGSITSYGGTPQITSNQRISWATWYR